MLHRFRLHLKRFGNPKELEVQLTSNLETSYYSSKQILIVGVQADRNLKRRSKEKDRDRERTPWERKPHYTDGIEDSGRGGEIADESAIFTGILVVISEMKKQKRSSEHPGFARTKTWRIEVQHFEEVWEIEYLIRSVSKDIEFGV